MYKLIMFVMICCVCYFLENIDDKLSLILETQTEERIKKNIRIFPKTDEIKFYETFNINE